MNFLINAISFKLSSYTSIPFIDSHIFKDLILAISIFFSIKSCLSLRNILCRQFNGFNVPS